MSILEKESKILEYPAIDAVFGYLWGLSGVVQILGSEASNLIYQHVMFPTLFVGLLWFFTQFLTPEFVFDRITQQATTVSGIADQLCHSTDNEPALQAHRADHE